MADKPVMTPVEESGIPESESTKLYCSWEFKVRRRNVKAGWAIIGALINQGAIPLPDQKEQGVAWLEELQIAVLVVAETIAYSEA